MANIISRGQITIVDLNDAKALLCYLQSNQGDSLLYDPASKAYTPNFSTASLQITPKIYITGNPSTVEGDCKNFKWTIDGRSLLAQSGLVNTVVNGGGKNDAIGCLVSSTGVLTIKNNLVSDNLALTFECDYKDDTHITALKTIIRTSAASTLFLCLITTPDGDTFDKNIDITAKLKATCNAYHGANPCDSNNTSYTWYKLNTAATSTSDLWTNFNKSGKTIEIERDDVLNFQTYKCVVRDGEDTTKTCEALVTFHDQTDPYTIDIVCPTGNIIKNGQGSTTLIARVYQGPNLIEDENTPTKLFDYTWSKYDLNGGKAESWSKTGNTIEVLATEITNKATFFCEITLKPSI